MKQGLSAGMEEFHFRDLHPKLFLGTASDRYAGWLGQIYSLETFGNKVTHRSKQIKGQEFEEKVLPVASVREYFRHFRTLELDFPFYAPLLDRTGRPGPSWNLLNNYRQHLGPEDRLILKVPQEVFARRLQRGKTMVLNEDYLNPRLFVERFYAPVLEIVGPWLAGLVFEQEYQRKEDRPPIQGLAQELDDFFDAIPKDYRYHVELRTAAFLTPSVFNVLQRHKVGQVLSHWTWLPPLCRQFALSGETFFNGGRQCIIRLMTPLGMRYEEAYARAFPFDRLVEGMQSPAMVPDTVHIVQECLQQGVETHVIVNNRSGGNAPLIAQQIARQFVSG